MRYFMIALCFLTLLVGCTKKESSAPKQNDNTNPIGDTGGTVQAVRKAAQRPVTQNDFKGLQIYIDNYFGSAGKMPTKAECLAAAKTSGDKHLTEALENGSIVIKEPLEREGIWAYERDAQTKGGHILTAGGVERLNAAEAKQRFQQ